MDGVIVDSNPLHREAWAAFNRRYGLETTEAMHESMYGKRNDEIVRNFFGDGASRRRGGCPRRRQGGALSRDGAGRLEEMLVPGLKGFLDEYRGAPMGLASNGEPENIEFILEEAGLRPYFRAVVDGHQVVNPKPDPEIYLKVADILRSRAGELHRFRGFACGGAGGAGGRYEGSRNPYYSWLLARY